MTRRRIEPRDAPSAERIAISPMRRLTLYETIAYNPNAASTKPRTPSVPSTAAPMRLGSSAKLSAEDIRVLRGEAPYSEKVPDVDEGFTQADLKDPQRAQAIYKVIRARLAKAQQERPIGFLVRHAPASDVRDLQQLTGHLTASLFITKFRKTFARDEMNDDLSIVPARYKGQDDVSEYEEILPSSPP